MIVAGAAMGIVLAALAWVWWLCLWMPGRRARRLPTDLDARTEELVHTLRRDLTVVAGVIGARNVSHRYPQLQQTVAFLERSLAEAGYEVRRQEFVAEGRTVCNLDVERTGTTRPGEIIVVGAHYDTVPGSPGANDNGSAMVATLALARAFATLSTHCTLRFAFFVNEEWPYHMTREMGALQYAQACKARNENVVGMLALETIGYFTDEPHSQRYPLRGLGRLYPTTGNFLAFVGNVRSRRWVHRVLRGFRTSRFPSIGLAAPELLRDIFRSDHAAFWACGYPALMVTDTADFRYPHYHASDDTPDKVDFDSLARVVTGLEHALREVAGATG